MSDTPADPGDVQATEAADPGPPTEETPVAERPPDQGGGDADARGGENWAGEHPDAAEVATVDNPESPHEAS